MIFFIIILLLVFSYDFTKMRNQMDRIIEQNDEMIQLMKKRKEEE
ncbi:hypothetical protein MKZ08_11430 [Viridibacillus sp. FSL R5-0477]|nr:MULTISPECIES: hypothetical protein [Viridibacillus]